MPVEFEIGDDDIAFAESVLLPRGSHFDEERKLFISCLETADLQAVPGSGKTTALLAKLLAMERHLSIPGSPGVLVISHTNAAVNEIRGRIGAICPRLFAYPNFVGTIQSFVDAFLAIPSFIKHFGFRPSCIDADVYNSEIVRRYQGINVGAKKWIERQASRDPEELVQMLRFDSELNLTKGLGGKVLLKRAKSSATYKTLSSLKTSVFKSGLLHFEDVFLFANRLLQVDTNVKRLLQSRFKFVFVDEMQDMAPHQHGILEAVFGAECDTDTVYQRIGDADQAIFGGDSFIDVGGWTPRTKILTLSNSLRLSQPIARILAPFAYERDESFEITGLQSTAILPHLLIFDDDSVGSVVERFAEIIAKLRFEGKIPTDSPERYMAVAWNSVWNEDSSPREGKRRLIDFCPSFQRSTLRKQEEFNTLADYLYCVDPDDRTLRSARNGILRAICRALRLGDVVDPLSGTPFSSTSLVRYLRSEFSDERYGRCNSAILKWSLKIVAGEPDTALRELRRVLPRLIKSLGGNHANAVDFLSGVQTVVSEEHSENDKNSNSLRFGEIIVGLGTVHSVKGQTHTATLYIESAYRNDSGRMYESQRLADQFMGKRLNSSAGKHVKESARMVYVGFSRPTHLLVFAVHKENYDSYLSDIDTSKWKIVHANEGGNN